MKYMKNHFAGILSVILAVVHCRAQYACRICKLSRENRKGKETIVKLDEKLGAEPGKVLEELKNTKRTVIIWERLTAAIL